MASNSGSTQRNRTMLWRIAAALMLLIAVLLAAAQVWQLQQEGTNLPTAIPTIIATARTPPTLEGVPPTPAPETTIEG